MSPTTSGPGALPPITVTHADVRRLSSLLDTRVGMAYRSEGRRLRQELRRAAVVEPRWIGARVVTMNSRFTYRDGRGAIRDGRLVYPWDARQPNALSILSVAGTAVLGLDEGMRIDWPIEPIAPGGPLGAVQHCTFEILTIHYQPEAAGDWHL